MSTIDYDERQKTIRFQPRTRHGVRGTYEICLISRLDGYYVIVTQLLLGGERRPVTLIDGPRYTLHPGQFYPLRLHYRGELIGEIMAALRHGAVEPIAAQQLEADDLPTFDCYLRADLDPRFWPNGYDGAIDDDLADWRKGLSLEEQG